MKPNRDLLYSKFSAFKKTIFQSFYSKYENNSWNVKLCFVLKYNIHFVFFYPYSISLLYFLLCISLSVAIPLSLSFICYISFICIYITFYSAKFIKKYIFYIFYEHSFTVVFIVVIVVIIIIFIFIFFISHCIYFLVYSFCK